MYKIRQLAETFSRLCMHKLDSTGTLFIIQAIFYEYIFTSLQLIFYTILIWLIIQVIVVWCRQIHTIMVWFQYVPAIVATVVCNSFKYIHASLIWFKCIQAILVWLKYIQAMQFGLNIFKPFQFGLNIFKPLQFGLNILKPS